MAINLVSKFAPLVDERFAVESKSSLVTNKDYDFIGAKSIKLYSVNTAEMNDYGRNTDLGTGEGEVLSRYGSTGSEVTINPIPSILANMS